MRYRYYTADVFTQTIFGGNQLAVFPKAEGLKTEQMQRVARELNLSETVFVFPAQESTHTRRLRIFTPGTELPFAGHPTIGSAYILTTIGEIPLDGEQTQIVFEEGVGPVKVLVQATGGQPTFAQLSAAQMPEFGPEPPARAELAALLSLQEDQILEETFTTQAVSCGVPFLFIPLRDRKALQQAQLDVAKWKTLLASYWAPHVYIFTPDPELEGSNFRARMFAPAMGIQEDPATGAAATAFAGYLDSQETVEDGTFRWIVEQGFEMERPSILEVEADKQQGKIVAIRVGGASVLTGEGLLEIPAIDH
ncbi:PhzF family phenazine biosynthesis protein [Leptolyngbya sp. FACHB-261]|uniref:PhzF family phenazine biosynthesis protein n=1 Tax=Leptolyngbya sp. FACHB-261 TaxID=2692806 RepID=UPI0016834300|nr:PhzF family phenazine biosynthesis protein [Leptolyngbya sp. FACHB-261]MBD2101940.1 PhzF family phenazine biosynthesis protein [Leptolyngbya sp. FACHB-261]